MSTVLNTKTNISYSFHDVLRFVHYVNEFYNENDGVYPIASKEEIVEAVSEYMIHTEEVVVFDSVDRERVRQILQPEYSMI